MSGRNKFSDLSDAFLNDPERGAERRKKAEELSRAYDALLAGAEAGLSDEELEELAEVHGLLSDTKIRGSVEEAEAEIEVLERAGADLSPLGAGEMKAVAGGIPALAVPSYTTAEVAGMLGWSEGRVRGRIKQRTLYAFPEPHSGRGHRLPAFQFEGGREVPGIGGVLELLDPELHPVEVSKWFTRPDADLYLDEAEERPVSPREWLLAGGAPDILKSLAREL